MSDEKPKPFAFMAPDPTMSGNEWEALYVAGIWVKTHRPAYGGGLRKTCDDINAAVEQREARLRGALGVARDALDYIGQCGTHGQHACETCTRGIVDGSIDEPTNRALIHDRAKATEALSRIAALAGTGPDYVPRADLDAALAKVKQMQAAIDALDPGLHATGAQVAAYLEASGLRKPDFVPLHERQAAVRAAGDSDLIVDLVRRGYDIDTATPLRMQFGTRERLEEMRRAGPPQNLLPVAACSTCGEWPRGEDPGLSNGVCYFCGYP